MSLKCHDVKSADLRVRCQMLASCHVVMIGWLLAMLFAKGWTGSGAEGSRAETDQALGHLAACLGGWGARLAWLALSSAIAYNGCKVMRQASTAHCHYGKYAAGVQSLSYLVIGLMPDISGAGAAAIVLLLLGGAALVVFSLRGVSMRLRALAAYPVACTLLFLLCVLRFSRGEVPGADSPGATAAVAAAARCVPLVLEWGAALGASWAAVCYGRQERLGHLRGPLGGSAGWGVLAPGMDFVLCALDALNCLVAAARDALETCERALACFASAAEELAGAHPLDVREKLAAFDAAVPKPEEHADDACPRAPRASSLPEIPKDPLDETLGKRIPLRSRTMNTGDQERDAWASAVIEFARAGKPVQR